MADRFWIASTAQSWNDTNQWSTSSGGSGGASVPIAGDDANFDNQGVGNCTLDVNVTCDNIKFDGTNHYTGTWDADTFNVTTGDFGSTNGNRIENGTLRMGSGTWSVSGNLRADFTGLFGEAAPLTMTGSSKEMQWGGSADDSGPNVTIDSGATITCMGNQTFNTQGLTVNGSLTLGKVGSNGVIRNRTNGVSLGNSSSLLEGTAASNLRIDNVALTVGTSVTITAHIKFMDFTGTKTVVVPSATYDRMTMQAQGTTTYRFGGNATFNGQVEFTEDGTRTLIVDNATNNPDLTFKDSVLVTSVSTFTWTKGTGTITISGTGNQSLDFEDETIEDLDIDKTAGTATLTDGLTTDSLTITDGTFDVDGNSITVSGNLTQAANTTVQDTTGGALVTVGGNLDINGTSGNECVWNGPDLAVTGTADADFTTATNSDASGGTEVDATDNCTDGGGNTNWNFGATVASRALVDAGLVNHGIVSAGLVH